MEISKDSRIIFPKNYSNEKINKTPEKNDVGYIEITDEEGWQAACYAAYAAGVASVLMQKDCPKDIENEIYQEIYNQNCDENSDDKEIKSIYDKIQNQFPLEEGIELMRMNEEISKHSKIINGIISAKNEKDGSNRFNGIECAEIFAYADTINENPKAFSAVMNAQNPDNSPRYNSAEICKFLEIAPKIEKYSQVFDLISNFFDTEGQPVFSAEECIKLMRNANLIKKNQDVFVKDIKKQLKKNETVDISKTIKLLKQTSAEKNENSSEPLTRSEVEKQKALEFIQNTDVYKLVDEVSQDVNDMINVCGRTLFEASKIKANIHNYPKLFYELHEMLGDGTSPRFSDEELILLANRLSYIRGCKSNFMEIAKCKNQEGKTAFNAQECLQLTSKLPEVVENVKYLLSVKDPETGKQRFSSREISSDYIRTEVYNKKAFERIAAIKDKNTGKYRFKMDDCKELCYCADKIKEYPQVFEKLCNLKDGEKYRFDGDDISTLLSRSDLIEKYPDFFDKVVNRTNISGKKYSGMGCAMILEDYAEQA